MGNFIHLIKWNDGSLYRHPVIANTIAGFERNSPAWQMQQWQRQFNEWLEGVLTPVTRGFRPLWTPPEWFLRPLFWVFAVIFMTWLGWQLYRILAPYFYPRLAINQGTRTTLSVSDRPLTASQWWQRSRLLGREGNYREACRCLYQAALQQLDERKLIAHQSSRTDGEYRHLLQVLPQHDPYQVLIDTHERLCFSSTDIAAADFDRCQQAYREIGNKGIGNKGSTVS